jgi:hypothetical protein
MDDFMNPSDLEFAATASRRRDIMRGHVHSTQGL